MADPGPYDAIAGKDGPMERYAMSARIGRCLLRQGFCVVDLKPSSSMLQRALQDAQDLKSTGRFKPPPHELADGLLGEEGSALICEVEDIPEDDVPAGIQAADILLFEMGDMVQPMLEQHYGLPTQGRTHALLHEVGTPSSEAPKLDEAVCDRWLSTFAHHRVMVILFLGPNEGILELQPFQSEQDTEVFEVRTEPGMVVLLRADKLQHRLYGAGGWGGLMALSCWYIEPTRHQTVNEAELTPTARGLMEWGANRLGEIKSALEVGITPQEHQDLPLHWILAANRVMRKIEPVAIKSTSCRFPASFAPNVFSSSLGIGADFSVEVPRNRFNVIDWFDDDLESYKWMKSYARHGVFIDGAELFDCRFFGVSPVEAQSMDPTQYLLMEAGYEALYLAGRRKKDLMQALIGVYIGQGYVEAAPKDSVAMGGTGAARAVSCGRISFALGMQGPCCAIDAHGATALSCLEVGHQAILNQKATFNTALSGTVMLTFSPQMYVYNCAAHVLSPSGICCTFDESAKGYAKSEGCAFACLKRKEEVVDGQTVVDEDSESPVIAGIKVGSIGQSSHLGAPSAPAEQAVVADALHQADISALNLEIVECFGDGHLLSDAVEASYLGRCLRFDERDSYPLHLGGAMTNVGFMRETAGFAQLLKVIEGLQRGVQAPNLHFRVLNPHTDEVARDSILMPTEQVACRLTTNFGGMTSRGLGGTVGHAIVSCTVPDEAELPHVQPSRRASHSPEITYWPGGGGQLEDGAAPATGYSIQGSWSEWRENEPMQEEEPGVFVHMVTLPDRCCAYFQILLDGDLERVLHPDIPDAPPGSPVIGPDDWDDSASYCWMIDGREHWVPVFGPKPEVPASSDALASEAADDSQQLFWARDPDKRPGKAGDRYKVTLRVTGQWRVVDWEPLDAERAPAVARVSYSVVGSWNDWVFEDMLPGRHSSKREPGHFHLDVRLAHTGMSEFQIVANRDWGKVFHPAASLDWGADDESVEGPDDNGSSLAWSIHGEKGDIFRIAFARIHASGLERRTVACQKLSLD